jgi:hypothetical protein
MSSEISQADLIRVDVEKRLAESFDFSKASNKLIAVRELIESNQMDTTPAKLQKAYYPILKEYAKEQGVEVASKKKKVLQVNSSMVGGDMGASINPVPKQVPQSPNQPQLTSNSMGMDPNFPSSMIAVQHTPEEVSAMCNGFCLVIRSAFAPEAELLSDDEKKALGNIWLGLANKSVITIFSQFGGNATMRTIIHYPFLSYSSKI